MKRKKPRFISLEAQSENKVRLNKLKILIVNARFRKSWTMFRFKIQDSVYLLFYVI